MYAEEPQKNWWQRNWKWALPAGGCLTVVVLIVIFVFTLVKGVSNMFKESAPYQTAMAKAKESSWVTDRLGEPIEVSGATQGNVNYSTSSSEADLRIPIKGPKNDGFLMVWGKKTGDDDWTYKYIKFELSETGEVYDLINERVLKAEAD